MASTYVVDLNECLSVLDSSYLTIAIHLAARPRLLSQQHNRVRRKLRATESLLTYDDVGVPKALEALSSKLRALLSGMSMK